MRPAPGLDSHTPASARIWDYLNHGKDNYQVDRHAANRMLSIAPDTHTLAGWCREFLNRSIYFVTEAGIEQIIDVGTGFPTEPYVHTLARTINPHVTVTYIDYDPIVHAHCDALLATGPGLTALKDDIRNPHEVIDRLAVASLIDFNRPIAVLMTGVLDYVTDDEQPAEIMSTLRERMAPGSYLVITHACTDSHDELRLQMIADTEGSPAEPNFRTRDQIETLIKGFAPIAPGLVTVPEALGSDLPPTSLVVLSAVCELD